MQQEARGLPDTASHHLDKTKQNSAWKQKTEARMGPAVSASGKY